VRGLVVGGDMGVCDVFILFLFCFYFVFICFYFVFICFYFVFICFYFVFFCFYFVFLMFCFEWYMLRHSCNNIWREHGRNLLCCINLVVWCVWSRHWAIVLVMNYEVLHIMGHCCGEYNNVRAICVRRDGILW
jgi:hypothetical protein